MSAFGSSATPLHPERAADRTTEDGAGGPLPSAMARGRSGTCECARRSNIARIAFASRDSAICRHFVLAEARQRSSTTGRIEMAHAAAAKVAFESGGQFIRETRRDVEAKGWDLAGLVGGKAFFFAWTIAVPLLFYPWWVVLGAYVGFTMVTSVIMAASFQLAHCVEEASFTSPAELGAEPRPWAVHQVETTVDCCARNRVLTWLLGGLNFQIEHHLFPRVPHTHYPQIAR